MEINDGFVKHCVVLATEINKSMYKLLHDKDYELRLDETSMENFINLYENRNALRETVLNNCKVMDVILSAWVLDTLRVGMNDSKCKKRICIFKHN